MVIRNPSYPRLPRLYWGEIVYATPGCGKTYIANKYRDVVDGDELIVQAISEVNPGFCHGEYDDPRRVIFRFFEFIHFNRRTMQKVYASALRKMRRAQSRNDVVLLGTMDLMDEADRIFIEKDSDIVRAGFEHKQYREQRDAADSQAAVHHIYEYLENSMQRLAEDWYYKN